MQRAATAWPPCSCQCSAWRRNGGQCVANVCMLQLACAWPGISLVVPVPGQASAWRCLCLARPQPGGACRSASSKHATRRTVVRRFDPLRCWQKTAIGWRSAVPVFGLAAAGCQRMATVLLYSPGSISYQPRQHQLSAPAASAISPGSISYQPRQHQLSAPAASAISPGSISYQPRQHQLSAPAASAIILICFDQYRWSTIVSYINIIAVMKKQ